MTLCPIALAVGCQKLSSDTKVDPPNDTNIDPLGM